MKINPNIPDNTKNQVRRHMGREAGAYRRLDHLEKISWGVRRLYLFSSRSDAPIGDSL